MNERQLWKSPEHSTVLFPAWCSVKERKTGNSEVSVSAEKQKTPLGQQNSTYFIFLAVRCQFPFFIASDSGTVFDKDRDTAIAVQEENAEVSFLSGFSLLNLSTGMKFNHPLQD